MLEDLESRTERRFRVLRRGAAGELHSERRAREMVLHVDREQVASKREHGGQRTPGLAGRISPSCLSLTRSGCLRVLSGLCSETNSSGRSVRVIPAGSERLREAVGRRYGRGSSLDPGVVSRLTIATMERPKRPKLQAVASNARATSGLH